MSHAAPITGPVEDTTGTLRPPSPSKPLLAHFGKQSSPFDQDWKDTEGNLVLDLNPPKLVSGPGTTYDNVLDRLVAKVGK